MFLLLLLFFSFVFSVSSDYRFDCYENYCSTKGNECPAFSCEDGRTVENATKCGCCPLCIRSLKEGEECISEYYGWRRGIVECGFGLICKVDSGIKAKCVPTECLQRKRNYEQIYSSEVKPQLKPTFECDHFGNFEPSDDVSENPAVVCINDVLCFCVDKNGKRIFGTDFAKGNASESNMNCGCSQDINDFPTAVDSANLPRCLSNGDYDPLQCIENKCFCMDSAHYHEYEVFDSSEMKKLYCYNEDRHKNNRTSKCFSELEEKTRYFKGKNLIVIGADYTKCELDGTYFPLQCKKGRCFCVKRNGEIQSGYENVKKEDGKMLCRCLRDKEIIESYKNRKTSSMKIFEGLKCDAHYTSDKAIIPEFFIKDFMKH